MWMATDFECMNVLINDNDNVNVNVNDRFTAKLFVNKPVAIGYNVVKNPDYENLTLEKSRYIKYFGEDCIEWIINEMIEIESYMKVFLKISSKLIIIQFQKNMIKILVGYVEKVLNLKM